MTVQLYQVHRFIRDPQTGVSHWVAVRPSHRHNEPPRRPYAFTLEDAIRWAHSYASRDLEAGGLHPRIVAIDPTNRNTDREQPE